MFIVLILRWGGDGSAAVILGANCLVVAVGWLGKGRLFDHLYWGFLVGCLSWCSVVCKTDMWELVEFGVRVRVDFGLGMFFVLCGY